MKSYIDVVLEGCRRVCEAKRHNYIFVMAITRAKSYFLLISLFDSDPVVGVFNIDLAKEFSPGNTV